MKTVYRVAGAYSRSGRHATISNTPETIGSAATVTKALAKVPVFWTSAPVRSGATTPARELGREPLIIFRQGYLLHEVLRSTLGEYSGKVVY